MNIHSFKTTVKKYFPYQAALRQSHEDSGKEEGLPEGDVQSRQYSHN